MINISTSSLTIVVPSNGQLQHENTVRGSFLVWPISHIIPAKLTFSSGNPPLTILDYTMSMSLIALPSELHLEILGHLDLQSLLATTSTNKYFHALPTTQIQSQALFSHEAVLLDHWKANHGAANYWDNQKKRSRTAPDVLLKIFAEADNHTTKMERGCRYNDALCARVFPCYSCNKTSRFGGYSWLIQGTEFDLCGSLARRRICIKCDVAKGSPFAKTFRVLNDYPSFLDQVPYQ